MGHTNIAVLTSLHCVCVYLCLCTQAYVYTHAYVHIYTCACLCISQYDQARIIAGSKGKIILSK